VALPRFPRSFVHDVAPSWAVRRSARFSLCCLILLPNNTMCTHLPPSSQPCFLGAASPPVMSPIFFSPPFDGLFVFPPCTTPNPFPREKHSSLLLAPPFHSWPVFFSRSFDYRCRWYQDFPARTSPFPLAPMRSFFSALVYRSPRCASCVRFFCLSRLIFPKFRFLTGKAAPSVRFPQLPLPFSPPPFWCF